MDSFSPVFLLPILSVTGSQKGGYSLRGNGSMDFEMLKQVGVNVESAMERFMGNNALYAKMLKKFFTSPNLESWFTRYLHVTGKRRWRRLIR